MIQIPLYNRKGVVVAHATVDDEDAHLDAHRWWLHDEGYAMRTQYLGGGRANPRIVKIRMHREIMDPPPQIQVDHIDGNRLNNRRGNLRLVTHAQQMQNRGPQRNGKSRYRGVWWEPKTGKWRADVMVAGTRHRLGYFADEDAAGKAASDFRLAHMTHTNEARATRV